jgi:hypothetical protein
MEEVKKMYIDLSSCPHGTSRQGAKVLRKKVHLSLFHMSFKMKG